MTISDSGCFEELVRPLEALLRQNGDALLLRNGIS